MATRRLTLVAVALCSSVVLAAGCGGTSGPGSGAAGIVPASVAGYIAIDTDLGSSQFQTADDLASRFPDKQKGIDAAKRDLRKEEGLEWERDIKPALGPELDLVLLDLADDANNVVALMQPADEGAFKRLIAKGNAKNSKDKVFYAKVGDWEVISDKQSKIDRFRRESRASDARLADEPAFKRGMKAVSDDALAKVWFSGAKIMDTIDRAAEPNVRKFVTKVGTLDWIVASLRATSDGARFDTIVRGTPGELFNGIHASPGFHASLPSRVPSDALFYFTFHGTKGMFNSLNKIPELQSPDAKPAIDLLQDLGTLLQVENAFYVRRPASGEIPEVTLVTEPKPGTNGAAKLDDIFLDYAINLGTVPTDVSIAGVPAHDLDFGPFHVYYANVGGKLAITDLRAGIKGLKSGSPKLEQSDTFKDALDKSGMPSKTQGFAYVDVRGGLGLAERLSQENIPPVVKRNLKPLRSAVEYAATRPSEVQVTLFLRIK
jgi:hypothetical protein